MRGRYRSPLQQLLAGEEDGDRAPPSRQRARLEEEQQQPEAKRSRGFQYSPPRRRAPDAIVGLPMPGPVATISARPAPAMNKLEAAKSGLAEAVAAAPMQVRAQAPLDARAAQISAENRDYKREDRRTAARQAGKHAIGDAHVASLVEWKDVYGIKIEEMIPLFKQVASQRCKPDATTLEAITSTLTKIRGEQNLSSRGLAEFLWRGETGKVAKTIWIGKAGNIIYGSEYVYLKEMQCKDVKEALLNIRDNDHPVRPDEHQARLDAIAARLHAEQTSGAPPPKPRRFQ